MKRVTSLTESTLLHRWALDLLSPPDFQKLQIPYEGDSVLEAIKLSPKNTHSNLKNTSWWYSADQYYLLTPIKAVFVAAVTLTISRLGVVYHALMTPFYYLKCRVSANPESVENSWKKTKEHAVAFFFDAVCAGVGAIFTKFAVESTIGALHYALGPCSETGTDRLKTLAILLAGTILCMGALASAQSARVAPEFLVRPDHRVGMYLSLFFRKKLGLVGSDGGLLPFSAKDKLEYQETREGVTFNGDNYDILGSQIYNAELDLIEAVQACNELLPKDQRIPFQYPLDGEAIARKLEEFYAKEDTNAKMSLMPEDKRPILLKADEIRALQLKIKYSKEIFEIARKLTYNDGFLMTILKGIGKISPKSLKIESMVSSIPHETYNEYFTSFNARFSPSSSRGNFGEARRGHAEFSWNSLKIPSINPNQPRPAEGIYAQFSYDVAVNKWKEEHNLDDLKNSRDLLGLDPNETYNNYKQIKKQYLLACHPDKHQGDPTAMEIQACLNAILEKLDEEYKA
jgi:hypothetical protein